MSTRFEDSRRSSGNRWIPSKWQLISLYGLNITAKFHCPVHHQTALLLLPHINQQLSLLSPRPPRRPLQFRIDAMWQFLLASGCGIQLFRNEKCVLKKRPVTFYYSLFNLYFYICIYRVLLLSLSKFIPPASGYKVQHLKEKHHPRELRMCYVILYPSCCRSGTESEVISHTPDYWGLISAFQLTDRYESLSGDWSWTYWGPM